jgi:hypothetical protein
MKAEGLGEAGKVTQTMKDIENAARRLGSTGVGSWGTGFQKQLAVLKLTRDEMKAVERSWINLHESVKSRNLAKAMKNAEVSHWKTNTLAQLAQQRAAIDRHFKAIEARGSQHALRMGNVMKAAIVATGVGYTLPYAGGMAIRGGLTAASEQTRTKYRLALANVDPEEIKKMEAEAARLSAKYGSIDEQDILELNRASYALMGGDGDKARALMEPIIRSFIADVTAVGVEKAGENLSSFLKAMDNLNVNEGADGGVDDIEAILEGWTKAKQIEGKDLDVSEILGFALRAKVAKYALSDEFLTDYAPALGQDMGFDALGDALSGAYQNLVTPSSGGTQGQYVKRQKAMGLRDANNSLIERDLYSKNPYRWTLDVLKPLLAKNGVDTNNTAAVAEAVKKLMSNSKAAAMITGWIEAETQIEKNIALYKKGKGTSDVENARMKDPFAAAESFMAALRNFSAAILPMEAAAAGLNTLADGINALAAAARDNPALAALGIGVGGAALYGGGKYGIGKLADLFGLKSSALALDGSAAALTRAAVALGGAGVADDVVPDALKKAGGTATGAALAGGAVAGTAAAVAAAAAGYAAYETVKQTSADNARENKAGPYRDYSEGYSTEENAARNYKMFQGVQFEGGMHRVGLGAGPAPGIERALADLDKLRSEAAQTGSDVKSSLGVTVTPNVDSSSIDSFLAKVRAAIAELERLGSSAAASSANTDRQLRRSMADYGVAP